MTPIEACIEAVAYNHGIDVRDVANPGANRTLTYHRRLAAYVAHTTFAVPADDVARHFGRTIEWAYDVLEQMTNAGREERLTARDIEDTKRRARALFDRHGGGADRPKAAVSLLGETQTAEAIRLRAKGWSVTGLAKRYGVPPEQIAPMLGEPWGRAS